LKEALLHFMNKSQIRIFISIKLKKHKLNTGPRYYPTIKGSATHIINQYYYLSDFKYV